MVETILKDHIEFSSFLIPDIFKKFKTKNLKRQKIQKLKAKILIEKQIKIEFNRKINENKEYFIDQIKSWEDNLLSKEEYTIMLLTKLKQLDLYVSSKNQIGLFKKYKGFKVSKFIQKNTNLLTNKVNLQLDIQDIEDKVQIIKDENYICQQEYKTYQNNKTNNINTNHNTNKHDQLKQNAKVQELLHYYNSSCRVLQSRIKLLNNMFKNMTKTLKYLKINKSK